VSIDSDEHRTPGPSSVTRPAGGGRAHGHVTDGRAEGADGLTRPLTDAGLDDGVVWGIVEAAPDGIVMTDGQGQIILVNQRTEELFGYDRGELLGKSVETLLPDDLRAAHRGRREGYAHGPRTRAMGAGLDLRARRRDGSEFPVEISLSPLGTGGTLRVIAIVRDISERRAAEAETRRIRHTLAVTEDRERIARDLHDTVIQRLFAAGMSLQGTAARIDDPEARARLERAVDELDTTIREIRTAIFALQAPADGGPGLRGDIVRLTSELRPTLGFSPRVQFDGAVEGVDPAIADQLLPVLREALTNVARHAGASLVRVSVAVGAEVVLRVLDDGVGVPPDVVGGNGLGNLRARAEGLGGTCAVRPRPEGGTEVDWRVPADAEG
jgi:PAS domain S-box-containing protein